MSESTHFNIAETICRKHTDGIYRIALEEIRCAGTNTYTFGGLDYLSDKFANTLQKCPIKPREVVAVLLPQSAAFIVAHFGMLKLGAIVAPIPIRSEPIFLKQVIQESQASAIVIDESVINQFQEVLDGLRNIQVFVVTDFVSKNNFENGYKGFWYEINFADADYKIAYTDESTPAYYIFEQDEARILKALRLNHGALLAASQTANHSNTSLTNDENLLQTSKDWASMNVLVEEIFPALYQGQRISAIDVKENGTTDEHR